MVRSLWNYIIIRWRKKGKDCQSATTLGKMMGFLKYLHFLKDAG